MRLVASDNLGEGLGVSLDAGDRSTGWPLGLDFSQHTFFKL